MKQLLNTQILRNKKTYKVGAATSLATLLAACGASSGATEGDDIFLATADPDIIDGLGGVDTVSYANSNALVNVNLKTNTHSSGYAIDDDLTSIENIIGSDFDDAITGDAQDNIIEGGAGADTIDGQGDLEEDTVSYANSAALVNINLATNIHSGGDADGDSLINIEAIVGSAFDDVITGDAQDNLIEGERGGDTISGGGGRDYLYGGDGDDFIYGNSGNDFNFGGDGNDLINGGSGIDTIDGGAGIDTLRINQMTVGYVIDKLGGKITVTNASGDDTVSSMELILLNGFVGEIDVKNIWGSLVAVEQAKFTGQAEFLSWLGEDAGYNYEGL